MALSAAYSQFSRSPTTAALADSAAIHYVPTLTSISEPAALIKHLAAQAKLFIKKSEKIISAVEGPNSLSAEIETTIEFVAGGGALLPGLDDNFLADKIVSFPMIHIVQFDAQQKISQIRLYWDQGSLLKQLEVIGSRGKNWPIRDGKDQLRLISASAGTEASTDAASRRSTVSRGSNDGRSHSSSITSATGDRRELSLFGPREEAEQVTPKKNGPLVAPRSSVKPPTRNLTDILSGTDNDDMPPPPTPSARPPSPRKNSNASAARIGSSKNYHAIRLFEDEEQLQSPEKSVKTHPLKYNHFEFGNGEGVAPAKNVVDRAKHASHWDFADFVTPEKPRPQVRTQDVRNFGWSEDEDGDTSPVTRPVVHKPRPDAKTNFDFTDQPDASEDKAVRPHSRHNDSMGLYKDNVVENSTPSADVNQPETKQPLTTVTNVDLEHRKKDFGSQFEMTDDSPSVSRTTTRPQEQKGNQNLSKVVKGLDASWHMYDEEPETSKKENINRANRTNYGSGPGGRKDPNARHWGFGEEE